jgi:DNA-binding transcriptional LysR family regulator
MTPLAASLHPMIQDFVASARAIAEAGVKFDKATSTQRFVIVIGPVGAMLFIPGVLRRMRNEAPHVTLGCYEVANNTIQMFNDGDADLLIVPTSAWLQGGDQSWFDRHPSTALPDDRLVCIASSGNDRVRDNMTFAEAAELEYIIPSYAATDFRAPAERPVAAVYGVELNVAAEAPLASIPEQIIGSPFAAIVSRDLARFAAGRMDLKIVDLPDGFIRSRPMRMFWPRRRESDPAAKWLRTLLLEELAQFDRS